ncbi:hypothetical protein K438DRAFT_1054909 [Mycena galopus ATCC 62051]|nr:hypothetical protein K438DRAFT_1054909 [Mycena galopus ATCC 62051]
MFVFGRSRGNFLASGRARTMTNVAVGLTGVRAADIEGAAGVDPGTAAALDGAARVVGDAFSAAATFVFPDLKAHAEAPPKFRDDNPHHRRAPAAPLPELAGPEDAGTTTRNQPNEGEFPYLVISKDKIEENMHPNFIKEFDDDPECNLYAVPFNGGAAYTRKLGTTNIETTITEAIAGHVNPATTTVFPIPPAALDAKGNYAGPIALGVWVENMHDRIRLIDQLIFSRDRTYAFWIVGREHLAIPWVLTIVTPSIGGGSIGAERALKAAASLFMWTDDAFGRALQQATYARDQRPLDERRLALSETIDVVYNELSKQYVVYARPCTTNAATWRGLAAIVQRQQLHHGRYFFKSEINPDSSLPGPRCVTCKNDDHLEPACGIIHRPNWWGPDTQIKYAREGQLTTTTSIANANAQASTSANINAAPTGSSRGQGRARGGNRRGNGGRSRGARGRGN